MRKFEEKEVVKVEKVAKEIKCDECETIIVDRSANEESRVVFYEVTTSHADWGNDSDDSIKRHDFCSSDCIHKHMERYFKEANGSERYEILRIEEYAKWLAG